MTPSPRDTARAGRVLLWAIGALLLVRLGTLALYPLMDTTEARYADIARRILVRSDWVTLWFNDTKPFWGKPPLSFWATAASFKLLGVNEFAARLPYFLIGVTVAALVWRHALRASQRTAWHAVAWLGATGLFFVASGSVMTDMVLALGTTLVMLGFWNAMHADKPGAAMPWCMVLGAVIGLLAKGPVSVILWGVPIGAWLLYTRQVGLAWQRIAWLRGAAVVLVLSLPWYLWAESRTPGFLEYFIVGEHWKRFITPGWAGDLYGSAHRYTRGTIWVFALGAVVPWPLLLPAMLAARRAAPGTGLAMSGDRRQASYLLLWALTPCVFFTMAGNILMTYVLPGLPALALLAGRWSATRERHRWAEGVVTAGVLTSTVASIGLLIAAEADSRFDRRSTRSLVSEYRLRSQPGEPLYFMGRVPFSGSFYSDGQARALNQLDALAPGQVSYLVLSDAQLAQLPVEQRARLTPLVHRGGNVLLRWH